MKYYVSFGKYQSIIHIGNPYAACVKTFESYFAASLNDRKTLPPFFSVSQKGFAKHDDDEIIGTDMIIKLIQMSNLAKKKLKKLANKNKDKE